MGQNVIVLTWESYSSDYQKIFQNHDRIRIIFVPPLKILYRLFTYSRFRRLQIVFFYCLFRPRLVFLLGQKAIAFGAFPLLKLRIPYLYLNDEFPSCWGPERLREEKAYSLCAQAIIVPDPGRIEPLRQELNLPQPKPDFCTVYNAPIYRDDRRFEQSLTDVFPFPGLADHPFVLNAGSVADWSQIPELMVSTYFWPKQYILLIHSRSSNGLDHYRQTLSHLDNERIIWSSTFLSDDDLTFLIQSAHVTTALYRDIGPNIRHVGLSSGKISRSIAAGTPVICSNFPSLHFIQEKGMGICVDHPVEIGPAIQHISENRTQMSANCINFARENFSLPAMSKDLYPILNRLN